MRVKDFVSVVLAACLFYTGSIAPSFAASSGVPQTRPGILEMTFDGLVARPILFLVTLAGAGVFVVTLPFSGAGDNVEEAKKRLIMDNFYNTFERCLGCMLKDPSQNQR